MAVMTVAGEASPGLRHASQWQWMLDSLTTIVIATTMLAGARASRLRLVQVKLTRSPQG